MTEIAQKTNYKICRPLNNAIEMLLKMVEIKNFETIPLCFALGSIHKITL